MKYDLPDRIVRELCSFAQKYSITKIVLFGSRARGTNTERSDIVQADAPISDELKEEIEKDGVVIYEKA